MSSLMKSYQFFTPSKKDRLVTLSFIANFIGQLFGVFHSAYSTKFTRTKLSFLQSCMQAEIHKPGESAHNKQIKRDALRALFIKSVMCTNAKQHRAKEFESIICKGPDSV